MSARGRTSAMTPVGDCLRRPKGRLAQLIAQNDRLAHVNRVLRAYLQTHLQAHAKIVSLGPHYWVLQADSSAWASRLRYSLPQLQEQLSEHFGDVPPLKLRVQPTAADADAAAPQRRMNLTQNSAEVLASAAEGVSDQRLGAALMRLAGNAARRGAAEPPAK